MKRVVLRTAIALGSLATLALAGGAHWKVPGEAVSTGPNSNEGSKTMRNILSESAPPSEPSPPWRWQAKRTGSSS
jgi:hypothetical protein